MTDIILTVRLGIDDNGKNRKLISKFSSWLNQEYSNHAEAFLLDMLKSAQVQFDGSVTVEIRHSLKDDLYDVLYHPRLGKDGNWVLDDLPLQNNQPIWIRLEHQWLKGRVENRGSEKNVIIAPELARIPIAESLFLRW